MSLNILLNPVTEGAEPSYISITAITLSLFYL